MKHLLIVGRAGIGKTTLTKRLVATLRGRAIDGFVTEELRENDQRQGFWLSPLDGRQMLMAHRELNSPSRVGPYRVNTAMLDKVAVQVIERGMKQARLLFLDEIGIMELCSKAFETAVQRAFDRGPAIVATVGVQPHPFLTRLKRRKDVELIPLSAANRESVEAELTVRLAARCTEDRTLRVFEAKADRICGMIVARDTAPIDIEIQQAALRDALARAFPEKASWYELLYDGRFRRLWQQFRGDATDDVVA